MTENIESNTKNETKTPESQTTEHTRPEQTQADSGEKIYSEDEAPEIHNILKLDSYKNIELVNEKEIEAHEKKISENEKIGGSDSHEKPEDEKKEESKQHQEESKSESGDKKEEPKSDSGQKKDERKRTKFDEKINGYNIKWSPIFDVSYEQGIEGHKEVKDPSEPTGKRPARFCICEYPAYITKKIHNKDNGDIFYEVTFFIQGKKDKCTKIIVPLHELTTSKHIHRVLAPKGLLFDDTNSKQLVDYFVDFIKRNENIIPVEEMYDTMGWKDDFTSFIIGTRKIKLNEKKDGLITEVVSLSAIENNDAKGLISGYSVKGKLKEWVDATRDILKYDTVRFSCYVSVASPLIEILNEDTRSIYRHGASSQGKTKSNLGGMSIWGDTKATMVFGNISIPAIEFVLNVTKNLPCNFDELQSNDPDFYKEFAYLLSNNKSRPRSNKDGTLRKGKTWCNTNLSSAEQQLLDDSTNTGVKVRYVGIKGGIKENNKKVVDKFDEDIKKYYGTLSDSIIFNILKFKDKIIEMYEQARKDLNDDSESCSTSVYVRERENIKGRITDTFAIYLLAGRIFETIMGNLKEETHDPLKIIKETMKENTQDIHEEPKAIKALKHTYNWISENRRSFIYEVIEKDESGKPVFDERGNIKTHRNNPNQKIYGTANNNYIVVNPKSLKKELADNGYNLATSRDDWMRTSFVLKNTTVEINNHSYTNGKTSTDGFRPLIFDVRLIKTRLEIDSPFIDMPIIESSVEYSETNDEDKKPSDKPVSMSLDTYSKK